MKHKKDNRIKFSEETKAEIVARFKSGEKASVLCKEYGCSHTYIRLLSDPKKALKNRSYPINKEKAIERVRLFRKRAKDNPT